MVRSRDGIEAAIGRIADTVGVFSVNLIIGTADELWALRYPASHELYVLDRRAVPEPLSVASPRICTYSRDLAAQPAVVVASEPMDGETGWRLMDSGGSSESTGTWPSPAAGRSRGRLSTCSRWPTCRRPPLPRSRPLRSAQPDSADRRGTNGASTEYSGTVGWTCLIGTREVRGRGASCPLPLAP